MHAQLDFRHKKSAPVFPKDLKHKGTGYFGGFGGSWATTLLSPERTTIIDNAVDTFWVVDVRAAGKTGLHFELGRYHLLEYSVAWRYFDYGLSYWTLRGRENWEEKLLVVPYSELQTIAQGSTQFSRHFVSAFANINNVREYAGKRFLQNSFGVRLSYNAVRYADLVKVPSVTNSQEAKGKILAQLHYKLGFGFKVRNRFLVIPSAELPFFNLWPFDFRMGGIGAFNSRYNPVLFNMRILMFSTRFKRYFR